MTEDANQELSRTPPMSVLEKLRRGVNFGCPVFGCGTPYLSWHHFDPPWRERHHHDPQGMIALCLTHASLADGNRWTTEQLREMKKNPYIKGDSISNYFEYFRRKVVCNIANLAYNAKNVLEIDGERVIGFEKDGEGYDRLNVLIRSSDNSIILKMENNFWTVFLPKLYDLRCSAQGRELEIRSRDQLTRFEMRFDELTVADFQKEFDGPFIGQLLDVMQKPSNIPIWTVTGSLKWGKHWIQIRKREIEDLNSHSIVSGNIVVNKSSALSYDENTFSLA